MNSPKITDYLKLALTRVLVPIILVLSLAFPLAAGPFEDAAAAHNKGDYATAFRLWRPFADQGNANAQVNLGLMYAKGQGTPQNYAEALKWFRLAANQGETAAQFNLGLMYATGEGVPQDYAEALKWYRLAAAQGNANAQSNLAVMYVKGQGTTQNHVEAL